MEQKHKNLRDVGLALKRLQAQGSYRHCEGNTASRSQFIPCGKLLRCGLIDGCTYDELRRPKVVINLRMDPNDDIDVSLKDRGVKFLHCPASNDLEKYDTSDPQVRAWLQAVLSIVEFEDHAFPISIHCRAGKDRTGIVVAALLAVVGVSDESIVQEFLLTPEAQEDHIRLALCGFQKAGGIHTYLTAGDGCNVDVDAIRVRLLGSSFSFRERRVDEICWLREEAQLAYRLAQAAAKSAGEHERSYWVHTTVDVCAELAPFSAIEDAAAALAFQGWALSQLRCFHEAREALMIGDVLARISDAPKKEQIQKMIRKELVALPEPDDESEDPELCVREVADILDGDLGDPHADLLVVVVGTAEFDSEIAGMPYWRALLCPQAFSWLRSGELAASATPLPENLPALEVLGLTCCIQADEIGVSQDNHWAGVVDKVATAISILQKHVIDGSNPKGAVVIHCTGGFGATCIALACFLVAHGLDGAVRSGAQPSMTAGEAIESLRSLRRGALANRDDEELVYAFAQEAWAKHVEKAQRAFVRPAASGYKGNSAAASRPAPSGARVVKQPGDGNCLFHSLAFGLGGGTAATLRQEICNFIDKNPGLEIAGTSLADWIQMLAGSAVDPYVKKMAKSATWGGAPEIAACAHLKRVNIHVYERRGSGFELTVPFDVPGVSRTVNVLYVGGVHYDGLAFP